MLVNPVQQTPLAYDAHRQVLTPQAPLNPLPQSQPATSPIEQGDTPQDKFQPRDGGGGNQQDGGTSDSQKAATAEQLHNAWLRLQQLQEEANEALLAGDASGAKDAAEEAAQVAVQIQDITGSSPAISLGSIEVAAQQISARDADQSQSGSGQNQSGSSGNGSGSGSSSPGGAAGTQGSPSSGPGITPGTSPNVGATGTGPSVASVPSAIPSAPTANPGSPTTGNGGGTSGSGSVIDIARAGLDTANDIVDTAASIPTQPAANQASIQGYKQTVLKAIAGVEAIAARLGHSSSHATQAVGVDIQA